jgi:hypothetical protein
MHRPDIGVNLDQVDDTERGGSLSDVKERFGRRLREVRTRVGISQERLAELAGLHRTYVRYFATINCPFTVSAGSCSSTRRGISLA